ncbi:YrhK family protein [Cellulomonas sp. Root485]|uniref:YrhK family protein n=1 Tax=Cellulomonas sp. Root485 TaxID=1736546 RepID=UPI0009EB1794|nr:YrhK family protein [Cellulomonas sp. Root485]
MTSTVPDLPAGWRVLHTHGPLGFVTHAVLVRPDGSEVEWSSRRHRKGLGLRLAGVRAEGGRASAMSWWIGSLFAVGSLCFALGSVPLYFDTLDPAVVAGTFFVGSIFFTSAGYLQFHETLRAPGGVLAESARPSRLASLVGWQPRRIDFWAVLVQLVGTVFFNISTFSATQADLTTAQARHLIWAPDVLGSICFLVASWFAYAEVNRGVLPRSDRSIGWRIAALNMLGSVAFGVSAVAARYVRSTGELANLELVNLGTFVGAVCFFVGAVLLPVESAKERSSA